MIDIKEDNRESNGIERFYDFHSICDSRIECGYFDISKRIKWLRESLLKVPRAQLSDLLDIGLTTIQQYENGKREPSLSFVRKLCHAKKISITWIIDGVGPIYLTDVEYAVIRFNDKNYEDISRRLYETRKYMLGCSRAVLAEHLRISLSTIQHYENADREPSIVFIRKFSAFSQVSVEWLIQGTGPHTRNHILYESISYGDDGQVKIAASASSSCKTSIIKHEESSFTVSDKDEDNLDEYAEKKSSLLDSWMMVYNILSYQELELLLGIIHRRGVDTLLLLSDDENDELIKMPANTKKISVLLNRLAQEKIDDISSYIGTFIDNKPKP